MKTPRDKYLNDPEYHRLVNMLEYFVETARFTPVRVARGCLDWPPEEYEIRDKLKKIDWSTVDSISAAHVKKYFNPALDDIPSRWIPWGLPAFGEKCPVPEGVEVKCLLSTGRVSSGHGVLFRWSRLGVEGDINAFQIVGLLQWDDEL